MFVSKNSPWVSLLRLNGSLSVPVGVYLCIFILCIFFFLLILIPSRRTQKTIQFKRPELSACHLAITLNRLCSEWAVFFHTQTTGLLQHPNIPSRERKKEERQGWRGTFKKNIALIKYSFSSGILLCSFSIRRSEVEKACYWSPSKKETHREEKETYFLWGETENRMNDATVDGKLLSATTKNELQTTVKGQLSGWVAAFNSRWKSLLRRGSDNMYVCM